MAGEMEADFAGEQPARNNRLASDGYLFKGVNKLTTCLFKSSDLYEYPEMPHS
ncbi:MAG: hypothetical protein KAW12_05815 [Candidatus Aminicenantes bacterium]|nr:hypothetical protein [Candidatus Aminicenantes bacterium]